MPAIKVAIVPLGNLKYPVDMNFLVQWKSKLFEIEHRAAINFIPDPTGTLWKYPDEQLNEIITPVAGVDFTLGIINAPLEENYYMRRLQDTVGVLSLYEMGDIITLSDFSIENFILRNIYELVVLYKANNSLIPEDFYTWAHADIRGCLFDLNAFKSDIVFSMHKPKLCEACRTNLQHQQIDSDLLPALDNELPKIRKTLYFVLAEFVKKHPVLAILVTALFAIFLNIISNSLYDYTKSHVNHQNKEQVTKVAL